MKLQFIYQGRALWILSAVSFLITYYILFVIRPFPVDDSVLKLPYAIICLCYAIIPVLWLHLMPLAVPKSSKTSYQWSIPLEVLYLVILLLLIGITNFLLRDFFYAIDGDFSWPYFKGELLGAFKIGIILTFICVLTRIVVELRYNNDLAESMNHQVFESEVSVDPVVIRIGLTASDQLQILLNNLIYIKAEGNYLKCCYMDDTVVQHKLVRGTLKSLQDDVMTHDALIRTHRSYIVNVQKIEHISGNSNGLRLAMQGVEDMHIPVSRSYIGAFQHSFQSIR